MGESDPQGTGEALGLFEREGELARFRGAFDDAQRGRGGVLLVEGEAGIGKTSLLGAAATLARERSVTVLRARGGELERDLAHGVVRQLFEAPVLALPEGERQLLLAGAAAEAASVIGVGPLAFAEARSPEDASFAIQHGLYWLTANLADRAPLLLCVDDAQWADEASLRWLVYVGRRLEDLAVVMAVAVRTGEPGAAGAALRGLRELAAGDVLEPAALSPSAGRRVVDAELRGGASDGLAAACQRASGGNPFLLGELARALTAEGHAADPAAVERLSPRAVSVSVSSRLARLPGTAAAIADAVSVLGADAAPRHARALAGLDEPDAQAAADALVAARVLQAGRRLQFIHPIVRTTVYEAILPARRSALHAHAARLLHEDEPDADRVAMHLLATEPAGDPWAVARLAAAGVRALARGAPGPAVTFLQRALAEPPDSAERPRLLVDLARAERRTDPPAAEAHLREALDLASDPAVRAAAISELAGMLLGSAEVVDLLERELVALPADASDARAQLEAQVAIVAQFSHARAAAVTARLDAIPDDLPADTAANRVLIIARAIDRMLRCHGPASAAGDAIECALADDHLLVENQAESPVYGIALEGLLWVERFDAAGRGIAAATDHARARGSRSRHVAATLFGARLDYFTGDLPRAHALAVEALDGIAEWGLPTLVPIVVATAVQPLVAMGELDRAGQLMQAELGDGPMEFSTLGTELLRARAELHLEAGRAGEALSDALEVLRRRDLTGGTRPPVGWRGTAARALWATGDEARATALAAEEVAVAEQWGLPGWLGMALRVQGLLTGGDEGIRLLDRAVELLSQTPRRLELARALVDHGAALRRARRPAASRDALRRGFDLATRCGAAPLAERAHQELLASGARPRRSAVEGRDALTTSERRVAELAAQGLSNRAIAQTLFVTTKTVESHLRAAFRKLDIGSRHDLAAALEAETAGRAELAAAG